jgi:hypothetical protein
MENSLHNVGDLSAAARSAIESMVGHPLRNDEVLYIATLGVKTDVQADVRNAAWDDLESIIAEMQEHASKSGLSSEQLDELIDSECAAQHYGQPE